MARIYYNKAKGEALLNALSKRDKGICEWRRLAGYENRFLISSNGMVYSLYNYHQMKLETLPNGYVYLPIMLQKPKRHVLTAYIHRLVALTFIPNPLNKLTVNHKDGNVLNNNVCNLEWATMSEQNYHACRVLGRKRDTSKIAGKPWWECRSLTYEEACYVRKYNLSSKDVEKIFGKRVCDTTLSKIKTYKSYKESYERLERKWKFDLENIRCI